MAAKKRNTKRIIKLQPEDSPSKISKSQSEDDRFCHGSIVRIKLHDFLTYDDCEFRPGPHLNVVMGPNGTGKSSIVCAICLGLGGHQSLLGRAREIGDFVKHRKSHAIIEIELNNSNGSNVVVRRDILKQDNKSLWYLNGKQTTQKEVVDVIHRMDVQMNNLCQFLPQDKVVEFAKMTQQQLLEATEKAVGTPEMFEYHCKLKDLKKKETGNESSLKEKQDHLERLQQRNSLLEREVTRYHERQKHMDTIGTLEMKRPWVEYEMERLKYIEAKERKDAANKQFKQASKVNQPLTDKLNEAKKSMSDMDKLMKDKAKEANQLFRKCESKHESLERLSEEVDEVKGEWKQMMEEENTRKDKIARLESAIASLKGDLEKAEKPEDLEPMNKQYQEDIKQCLGASNKLKNEMSRLKDDGNQLKARKQALTNELRRIEDVGNRRLESLRERDRDAYNAVIWLRNNLNKFSGIVHEPICLQINLKKKDDAKYVEMGISRNDLGAFVCENVKDQEILLAELRDKQKLRIAAVCPSPDPLSRYQPDKPIESLKSYGFYSYLCDLFDAPDAVMRYLCGVYRMHTIPVGTMETEKYVDQIINSSGLRAFYTPKTQYAVKTSRYGNREKITMTKKVTNARILSSAINMEQKEATQRELNTVSEEDAQLIADYKNANDEFNRANAKMEKLKVEKKELMKRMNQGKTLVNQIETKQKTLDNLLANAINFDVEDQKMKRRIQTVNKKRMKQAKDLQQCLQICVDSNKEKIMLTIQQAQNLYHCNSIDEKLREMQSQMRSLEDELKAATSLYELHKAKARQLLDAAREKTNTPKKKELSDELKAVFDTLPNTIEEIDDMIHQEKARADCNFQTDYQVVEEFEKNQQEIANFEREISNRDQDLQRLQDEINSMKEKWLVPLKLLLSRIDEQYGEFFRQMGCSGEVNLHEDPDDNYDKFGIEIKVKFREQDKLHVLTPHHQSGGERSVATMLYLISLQELTKCPFRVVDEINQGMDPNNERKVFELVVETVCRPNISQYFLITPKLLPDLRYSNQMTILTVMNGHWLPETGSFNIKDVIKARRSLSTINARAV